MISYQWISTRSIKLPPSGMASLPPNDATRHTDKTDDDPHLRGRGKSKQSIADTWQEKPDYCQTKARQKQDRLQTRETRARVTCQSRASHVPDNGQTMARQKESFKALCMYEVSRGPVPLAKITLATKRKICLLGSQAVKLMSEGQIEANLHYFCKILISRLAG